ncbi:MAG: glycosyltransferase family 9 protein [Candidatus Krumholzibacteriota bacterium]|nr:glycosyltransferase family 9 protein [Candidatus Krumholzibacteriota bacterium]
MDGPDLLSARAPRILVTRLRYLGDVILSIPAVDALRECRPDADIHYLAERPHHEILESHPFLDGVIPLDPGIAGTMRAVRILRRMRFDAAIDLFYNPRSANLLRLAGIPVRVGGGRRWRRRLYTHVVAKPPADPSAVSHHLRFVEALGCAAAWRLPRVHLREEERLGGARLLERTIGGGGEGPVIAVHPGGTWPAKRWPPERFAELARLAGCALDARILVVAGPGEEQIAREAAGTEGAVLPLQPIRTLAAVLSACDAVVCNDGGVMHLAVALGVPTVGIFGPTEPEIWFPYEGKGPFRLVTHRVACAPCHRHECDDRRCLDGIGPDEVFSALEEVAR